MHPITKTAVDLRRSVTRLQAFIANYQENAEEIQLAEKLIEELSEVRRHIPGHLRSADN